jgi:hypothetical protein
MCLSTTNWNARSEPFATYSRSRLPSEITSAIYGYTTNGAENRKISFRGQIVRTARRVIYWLLVQRLAEGFLRDVGKVGRLGARVGRTDAALSWRGPRRKCRYEPGKSGWTESPAAKTGGGRGDLAEVVRQGATERLLSLDVFRIESPFPIPEL